LHRAVIAFYLSSSHIPLKEMTEYAFMKRCSFCFSVFFLAAGSLLAPAAAVLEPLDDAQMLQILRERKAEQIENIARTAVRNDFSFTDRFQSSRITFTNSIVEDALKHFKPAHYDHGTGLAVADVDGDDRLDIYFVNQVGGSELWRNTGEGRFENVTTKAGVALADRIGVAASFADIDNDGDPDLFVTTVRTGNALFENLGEGRFRDITTEAGVDYKGHSSAATFFDVNNDGLLDLFVSNVGTYTSDDRGLGGYFRALPDAFSGHTKPDRGESSLLYINQGSRRFKESAAEFGIKEDAFNGDAAFADVNGDGFLDLYLSNMQGDDLFFLNNSGRNFTEAAAQFFPKTPWGAMGVNFADFNQDGLLDLYVTDMHSDMTGMQTKLSKAKADTSFETAKSEQWCTVEYTDEYLKNAANNIFGNALYLATAPGKFTESSGAFAAETFWPWGMSVGDVNADGFPDAFITAGMGYGFRYGINSLLLNDGGKRFAHAEFVTGIEPRLGNRMRKHAFTLDCAGADKDHPLCQGRSGTVPVSEALSSRSSAIFDLENDGDLDVVVNEMDDRPQILVNSLAASGNVAWLKLKLRGTASNRDGLGARVTLTAAGKKWHQQHDGKSGYLAQSSLPLYFGLGNAQKIDSIEISWPSGTKQRVTGLALNQLHTVTEPAK
jgi:hypothetical protein